MENQLCLLLGEVEGHGTPQIIYTVMAQATIKSRCGPADPFLRRSQRQISNYTRWAADCLYRCLSVCWNGPPDSSPMSTQGSRSRLLMRSQGYYAWQRNASYAPLGQSENVCYQVERLQLRQGDRLFFHTRGLDEICSREGVPFGQKQLRIELNKKNNRQEDLADQLYRLHFAAVPMHVGRWT